MEQESAASIARLTVALREDIADLSDSRDAALARLSRDEPGAYEELLTVQEQLLGACCAVLELVCISREEAAETFSMLLPALQAA